MHAFYTQWMNRFFIVLFLLIGACKSTQKMYDRGDYGPAFYRAIGDLKKNPDNTKALAILPDVYEQYNRELNEKLSQLQRSGQDPVAMNGVYKSLQQVYESVRSTPAAQRLVKPKDYSAELLETSNQAAALLYDQASAKLLVGDRASAQQAYQLFQQVGQYANNYPDLSQKVQEAELLAFQNVLVNTIDQRFGFYQLDANAVRFDIMRTLNQSGRNQFYRFFENHQIGDRRIDQFMDLAFYDIWIGQLSSQQSTYTVTKKVSEKDEQNPNRTREVEVTANITRTRRIIESRAVMDCRITDAASRRLLFTERFPAQYTWENITGTYTGDKRALSDKDWAIIRGAFNQPPSQDELYRSLTQQLMQDFSFRMRQVFRN